MRTIIVITLVTILGYAIALLMVDEGLTKSERSRCLVLVEQARTYPDYYITRYEADMCASFGLYPSAPIK